MHKLLIKDALVCPTLMHNHNTVVVWRNQIFLLPLKRDMNMIGLWCYKRLCVLLLGYVIKSHSTCWLFRLRRCTKRVKIGVYANIRRHGSSLVFGIWCFKGGIRCKIQSRCNTKLPQTVFDSSPEDGIQRMVVFKLNFGFGGVYVDVQLRWRNLKE